MQSCRPLIPPPLDRQYCAIRQSFFQGNFYTKDELSSRAKRPCKEQCGTLSVVVCNFFQGGSEMTRKTMTPERYQEIKRLIDIGPIG